MRVLVYASKESMIEPVCRIFQQCSLHADRCTTVEQLQYLATAEKYAAIIVRTDLGADELARFYSEWKKLGSSSMVIIVSTSQSLIQRARALELGVDRYYIEPHSYIQIVSDILNHEYTQTVPDNSVHKTTYFEVDLIRRSVKALGQFVELTKTEFDILAMFLRKRGAVLSRAQIWEEVWGYEDYPLANTVDVHINRLRKKLPTEVRPMLATVYGIGYRMLSDA